eukprot:scaffold234638_cov33-Tisochrysis_lutea.AAC.2
MYAILPLNFADTCRDEGAWCPLSAMGRVHMRTPPITSHIRSPFTLYLVRVCGLAVLFRLQAGIIMFRRQ